MTPKHLSTSRLLSTGLFDGLNSFDILEARISALPGNKERGDAFEIFAEAYFATQKIAQAKEVWPFEVLPLDQRKLLALDTGRDMGVDGTYLTNDGELRAYQVKFRSNRPSLTWDELSTFMGLTDQVSQRVLFTNCEALPSLMQDRSGFVAIRGSDLDRLKAEDFEAMRLWLQSGQVKLPRKTPKPHQQEALTAIASGLAENDRATVVMACGTGKSLVSLWAAEQYDCKNLLVLVPSLALVRQLLHEWLRETSWDKFTFMCVCSDPTVAKGADDLVVHQADLDFPVTTESAVVSRFLGKPFDGVKIVFSTYQSAQVVAEGLPVDADGKKLPFDLGIFDEAHKTASRDGTRFSFALEDANLPIRKRLFCTATPRHYDIRKKDKEGDNALVYSMDRPEVYGPVVHTLSFAEAARRGIICDYKVVISVITSAMVDEHLLKHGEVIVAGDTVKAKQVALQIALQQAVEKYGVSRIFTFHGSVAAARSFTSDDGSGIRQHLPDFTTLHVSGEMPTSRREDQMKAFRQADKAVMSNARCLTEGVDVPAVDMVAFISPRKSKVDIVQATGRAMRKSPGKEFGYVMVPLFVDQTANETIEEALKRTGFDDVWDLLGAMREQDDVLTDIIRQMREDKGRTGGYDESRFSERVEVLGPSVSLETIQGAITAECLESLGVSWDERFGELLAYKEEHGDTNVHQHWPTGLGRWVSTQRVEEKKGNLAAHRKKCLDEIDFIWDPLESQWEEMFAELLAYKVKHGHINIPQRPLTVLGRWIHTQRKLSKDGKLPIERKNRLDEINFDWDPLETKWERMFSKLLEYKNEHGNTNVPNNWPNALGMWIGTQRVNRKNKKLSAERESRLVKIGVDWNPLASNWDAMFAELIAYRNEHGGTNVPGRPRTELGNWVRGQRGADRDGALSTERKNKLSSIGFVFNELDEKWEKQFRELLEYKKMYGNANVPQLHPSRLGFWISKQRTARNNNELTPERQQRLEEIGVKWDAFENKWEQMFDELVAFKDAHGHIDVPVKDSILGWWISTQRKLVRKGMLSPDRMSRLENVGINWSAYESKWEQMFDELVEFKGVHGHTNVPVNEPLGRWVSYQRKSANNGTLSSKRKMLLDKLGIIWRLRGGI